MDTAFERKIEVADPIRQNEWVRAAERNEADTRSFEDEPSCVSDRQDRGARWRDLVDDSYSPLLGNVVYFCSVVFVGKLRKPRSGTRIRQSELTPRNALERMRLILVAWKPDENAHDEKLLNMLRRNIDGAAGADVSIGAIRGLPL
jgi:hypothetical protein